MKKEEKIPINALGKIIKNSREDKKISILELVDLINNSNINEKTISNWENGKSFPNLDEIYKLSEILELNPNELLELRNKIQDGGLKKPNFAARRVGNRALNFAKPGIKGFFTIIEILIAIILVVALKYVHVSYENMDTPVVYTVENTLDYYQNSNNINNQ